MFALENVECFPRMPMEIHVSRIQWIIPFVSSPGRIVKGSIIVINVKYLNTWRLNTYAISVLTLSSVVSRNASTSVCQLCAF